MPPGPVFRFGELFAGGGGGGGLLFAVLAAVDLVAGRAVLLLESARRTSALGAEGADITGAGVTDGAASGVAFGGSLASAPGGALLVAAAGAFDAAGSALAAPPSLFPPESAKPRMAKSTTAPPAA